MSDQPVIEQPGMQPTEPEEAEQKPVAIEVTRTDGRKVWIPKLRLSPSKMIVWQQCQKHLQFTLAKTLRDGGTIYTEVGTAVHKAIELINLGQEVDRENFVREELIRLCAEKEIGLQFPKSYKESVKALQSYEVPFGWHLASTEKKRVVDMGLYDFSYIIDSTWWVDVYDGLVKRAEQDYLVNDYKSSAAKPKTGLQIELYALMEKERLNLDPARIRACFWMTRTGQQIPVAINEAVLARTKMFMDVSVHTMYRMLADEVDFPATAGNCFFCQVQDCPERV